MDTGKTGKITFKMPEYKNREYRIPPGIDGAELLKEHPSNSKVRGKSGKQNTEYGSSPNMDSIEKLALLKLQENENESELQGKTDRKKIRIRVISLLIPIVAVFLLLFLLYLYKRILMK